MPHSTAESCKQNPLARAHRFSLHLPVRYRLIGEKFWHRGTTENISRSGLLFSANDFLEPHAKLEINLILPEEVTGSPSAEVLCRGEVVRCVPRKGKSLTAALAARILQYHFEHKEVRHHSAVASLQGASA